MSDTAEQLYEAFDADFPRISPKYFELYFGSWLRNADLKAEMLEPVRTLFLAHKEQKRAAEYKHRHPEKNGRPKPYECGRVMSAEPVERGYLASNPIRALRAANGMSIPDFCERAQVSDASLYKWERYGLPNDPMWHGRAIDRIGNLFNFDVDEACKQWTMESPLRHEPYNEVDPRPRAQKTFLTQKYRSIGHALIETERVQRELRIERSFAKQNFKKLLNRPNTPLDEMALLVAKMDRLHNREVSAEIHRLKLVEDRERTKRALDAIKRDEDIAAEWTERHKDELAPFKQDWKLYFGVPLIGKPDDGANVRVPSEDFTQMRAVDSTGHLLLEDAILAKIQKEREGYFVQLNYNGRSHAITLLNDDNYLPAFQERRALDDIREARTDKVWLASGGALNASGHRRNLGMLTGHDIGTAGPEYDKLLQEQAEREAIRRSKQAERQAGVYEIRKRVPIAPANDHLAPPMELPETPRVLPEAVNPMDLAVPVVDHDAQMAWKKERKDRRSKAGGKRLVIQNRHKKASQR